MIDLFGRKKKQKELELRERELQLEEKRLDAERGKLRMHQSMMQSMQSESGDAYRYAPPALPAGVVPKGEKSAIAMDSCASVYQYAGGGDVKFYPTFLGYPALAMLTQSSDYRSVPETMAGEMCREWGRLKIVEPDDGDNNEFLTDVQMEQRKLKEKAVKSKRLEKINLLNDRFKSLGIRSLVRKAIEVELSMGRAQIYIDLGSGKADLPLTISKAGIPAGSLKGFRLIEPMWSTPSLYNADDPTSPDFYVPERWYVLGRDTHADRLMTIIMRPVPDILKPAYNFGGISMLQLMKPYVERYQRTADSISQLVKAFSLTILSTDMSNVLAGNQDPNLLMRVQLFNRFRDNSGVMLMDKEAEEMGQINTPLSGLPELLQKSQEQMAAPSHIPMVKLLGVTPSGLNASSDGEIRVFYDYVMAQNEAHARPVIEKILRILQLDMFGEVDDAIQWEFNPLYQLDEKEMAEVQRTKSETSRNLVEGGIVSPEEARQSLASDEESSFSFIDVDDLPQGDGYESELMGDYRDEA